MIPAKPRLLVLTTTLPRRIGDATPGFVADLARGLEDDLDVTVLAPAVPGAALEERWGNVRVCRFRYAWPARAQRLADGAILPNLQADRRLWGLVPPLVGAQLAAAWRLARREQFDVIHAHWVVPSGLVALALQASLGIPFVVTSHGADLYALRGAGMRALKRRVLERAEGVTAVSTSLQRELVSLGVPGASVHIMPMGIDTARFQDPAPPASRHHPLVRGAPALLFVGRLAEKKGARYAVEALSQLLLAHPRVHLTIAGDGPERGALESLVDGLQLQRHVRFLGAVNHDDLPALYADAEVVLVPSLRASNGDTESFGLVIAEAMASGTPVVASAVGGIGDLVEHGISGLLVPERSAAALAAATDRLAQDPALRAAVITGGRERVRQLDHSVIAREYGGLLRSAAGWSVETAA